MKQSSTHLNTFFEKLNLPTSNIEPDLECEAYFGFNFQLRHTNVKFRKAKITPKKIGQFVTLWRRNTKGVTEPFTTADLFDYYVVYMKKDSQKGFFIFPKRILGEKHLLTNGTKEGKRGFRVYAIWDKPANKQAQKTKAWQTNFFVDLEHENARQKIIDLLSS